MPTKAQRQEALDQLDVLLSQDADDEALRWKPEQYKMPFGPRTVAMLYTMGA